jgi:hypothetical protein
MLAVFGVPQHTREQAQVAGKVEILHFRTCGPVCKCGFGCGDRYDRDGR